MKIKYIKRQSLIKRHRMLSKRVKRHEFLIKREELNASKSTEKLKQRERIIYELKQEISGINGLLQSKNWKNDKLRVASGI